MVLCICSGEDGRANHGGPAAEQALAQAIQGGLKVRLQGGGIVWVGERDQGSDRAVIPQARESSRPRTGRVNVRVWDGVGAGVVVAAIAQDERAGRPTLVMLPAPETRSN